MWEYAICSLDSLESLAGLNARGAEGWEAVGIVLNEAQDRGEVLLKRPLGETAGQATA